MQSIFIDPIANMLGSWSIDLSLGSVILRICLSLLLGAIIGCERATKRHSAGVRTFMLVVLASTLTLITDLILCTVLDNHIYLLSAATVIGVAMLSVKDSRPPLPYGPAQQLVLQVA